MKIISPYVVLVLISGFLPSFVLAVWILG